MSNLSTESADPRFRAHRLMSTVAAFGMAVTVSASIAFGFMVVPGMQHFGVGQGEYLLYLSVFTLAVAIGYLFTGGLISRFGVRAVSIVGSIGSVLSLAAMAYAPNITMLYVLAAVLGIAWTGCTLLTSTYLTTAWHNHSRRGTVVGLVAIGTALGGFIWGFLFPPIVAAGGFTGGFLALAVIVTISGVIPAIFLVRNPPVAASTGPKQSGAERRKMNRAVLGSVIGATVLLSIAFLLFSVESSFATIQPAVYAGFGVDPAVAGVLVSIYSVAALIVKPVLGYLYDKLGIVALVVTLVFLYLLGLPMIGIFGPMAQGSLFFLVPIASLSITMPSIIMPLIATYAVGSARYPVVYSVGLAVYSVGVSITTPLWGYMFDATQSYVPMMFIAGGLGILGVIVIYFIARLRNKTAAEPVDDVAVVAGSAA